MVRIEPALSGVPPARGTGLDRTSHAGRRLRRLQWEKRPKRAAPGTNPAARRGQFLTRWPKLGQRLPRRGKVDRVHAALLVGVVLGAVGLFVFDLFVPLAVAVW